MELIKKMVNTLGVKTKTLDFFKVQSEFPKPMKYPSWHKNKTGWQRAPAAATSGEGDAGDAGNVPWIFHWILSKRLTGFYWSQMGI